MSDDLVKWLRYCAPERRDCSRNELAMLDAADRIEQLEAALHRISLGSQDSGTTKEALGREARAALDAK